MQAMRPRFESRRDPPSAPNAQGPVGESCDPLYQSSLPGAPLKGPASSDVIQPP